MTRCRFCESSSLETAIDLGELALSGTFLNQKETVQKLPLAVSKCNDCGLVQLRDLLPIEELYGMGYGYESHLNSSMKSHLVNSAKELEHFQGLNAGDLVLDIASNDGTLLSGYSEEITKVGIDPTLEFLTDYYPINCTKNSNFFSAEIFKSITNSVASVITSFSVFYDLQQPLVFASDIKKILAKNGIWVLEQSYLPTMLSTLSFDTICHEHLLYLTLTDINNICKNSGLEIFNVKFNQINGGSFRVYVQHLGGPKKISPFVNWVIESEKIHIALSNSGLQKFNVQIHTFKDQLNYLISEYRNFGFRIWGLGASTKGNILLQVCNLTKNDVEAIGEINPKKFGKVTPGTGIPIINEKDICKKDPWLALVLPWHFKDSFISKQSPSPFKNGSLLFPLPYWPEIVEV